MASPAVSAAPSPPKVQLVLCRHDWEDVGWATAAFPSGGTIELTVYNGGVPLQLPGEKQLPRAWHDAFCYLEHIMRTSEAALADVTVFAPALPLCGPEPPQQSTACTERLLSSVRMLGLSAATLEPRGFAPIEPTPRVPFFEGIPRTGALNCLKDQYKALSGGRRDLHTDAELVSFSPGAAFAVARANLLAAPKGWWLRAQSAMGNTTAYSEFQQCCATGRTCVYSQARRQSRSRCSDPSIPQPLPRPTATLAAQ